MNKIFLTGNLTKDPEEVKTTSGNTLCKLILAVNKRRGEDKEPIFINIVCWNALAENCIKYLVKGSKILVNGELNMRTYDGSDLTKKHITEVIAAEIEFLNKKNNNND